jgi:hypothetical protein
VQMPIYQMIRNGMHALLGNLVPQVIISTVATLTTPLVTSIFPLVTHSAPPLALDDASVPSIHRGPAGADTGEPVADFMERVALSHVAALREPPVEANQADIVAVNEATNAPAVPLPPPRPAAAPRHQEPNSGKVHVAGTAPRVLQLQQPPLPAIEPAAASASAEEKPFLPLRYGMRLATNLGNIISASDTIVVAIVASMGDALTSVAKKL